MVLKGRRKKKKKEKKRRKSSSKKVQKEETSRICPLIVFLLQRLNSAGESAIVPLGKLNHNNNKKKKSKTKPNPMLKFGDY